MRATVLRGHRHGSFASKFFLIPRSAGHCASQPEAPRRSAICVVRRRTTPWTTAHASGASASSASSSDSEASSTAVIASRSRTCCSTSEKCADTSFARSCSCRGAFCFTISSSAPVDHVVKPMGVTRVDAEAHPWHAHREARPRHDAAARAQIHHDASVHGLQQGAPDGL